MKATTIALVIVSAYWIGQGIMLLRQDAMKGALLLIFGVLLLPLARYLWSRNIGGTDSSQ